MLADKYDSVCQQIRRACENANRSLDEVQLLAVSKPVPPRKFASCTPVDRLHLARTTCRRHWIKLMHCRICRWSGILLVLFSPTRRVLLPSILTAHSVDRLKVARRLSEQRPEGLPALNLCLQVNISGEASKSGCSPEELPELARAVAALPGIQLRGLMAIPEPETDPARQRATFARVRALMASLQPELPTLDTLSMGMSGDLDAAIAEGASIVRIGTALFGPRNYPNPSPTTQA